MKCLKERFNVKLLVVPLMVGVCTLIHRVVLSIGKLLALLKLPSMSYLKVAAIAKEDAVTERARAFVFPRFPMMWLPASTLAFGTVAPNEFFTTSPTKSSLPVPSFLYSVRREGHSSTSRSDNNGWTSKKGTNTHILLQNGKSTGMTIVALPFIYYGKSKRPVYDIYRKGKYLGYARSLSAAKRRAEAYLRKVRRS